MSVESAQYTENEQICAIIDGLECSFPDEVTEQHLRDSETDELTGKTKLVSSNPQRQMVLEWQAEGNSIAPYTPAAIAAPSSVSRRQFKMQISINGVTAEVNAWVSSQPELVQIAFNESGSFSRTDEMLQQGFIDLGFTTDQIDEFFIAASSL